MDRRIAHRATQVALRPSERAEAVACGRAWAERRWARRPEMRGDGPLFVLDAEDPPYGRTPAFWQEAIAEAKRWWVELQMNVKQGEI